MTPNSGSDSARQNMIERMTRQHQDRAGRDPKHKLKKFYASRGWDWIAPSCTQKEKTKNMEEGRNE